MIGPLEIAILVVILLVVFGAYKKLPELGRSAGRGARVGGEKAKELASQVGDKHGDKFDPAALGRSAGRGVREAREFRDTFKGALDAPAKPAEAEPAGDSAAEKPAEPEAQEPIEAGEASPRDSDPDAKTRPAERDA